MRIGLPLVVFIFAASFTSAAAYKRISDFTPEEANAYEEVKKLMAPREGEKDIDKKIRTAVLIEHFKCKENRLNEGALEAVKTFTVEGARDLFLKLIQGPAPEFIDLRWGRKDDEPLTFVVFWPLRSYKEQLNQLNYVGGFYGWLKKRKVSGLREKDIEIARQILEEVRKIRVVLFCEKSGFAGDLGKFVAELATRDHKLDYVAGIVKGAIIEGEKKRLQLSVHPHNYN